jgi:peptidoglycan L-alanyl-D-glutamate endopeptidase CwlK
MSSGSSNDPQVQSSLSLVAPKFAVAVQNALRDANAAGMDAYVYESLRSHELAVLYYARGRTIIPPHQTVTNATDEKNSWHGFGLAVDCISKSKQWNQPESWFKDLSVHFARYGCKWGGDWKQKDLPHFQWGLCKPSPSSVARNLLATSGMSSVWSAVEAS